MQLFRIWKVLVQLKVFQSFIFPSMSLSRDRIIFVFFGGRKISFKIFLCFVSVHTAYINAKITGITSLKYESISLLLYTSRDAKALRDKTNLIKAQHIV